MHRLRRVARVRENLKVHFGALEALCGPAVYDLVWVCARGGLRQARWSDAEHRQQDSGQEGECAKHRKDKLFLPPWLGLPLSRPLLYLLLCVHLHLLLPLL